MLHPDGWHILINQNPSQVRFALEGIGHEQI